MKLFVLSKKNCGLSFSEVCGVYKTVKQHDTFVFVETENTNYQRLAFTKEVYDVLFHCLRKDIVASLETYNWNNIIKNKTYKIESDTYKERILSVIWARLKHPHVDLKQPEVLIRFFFIGTTVYATTREWKNTYDFLSRKPHLRPSFYPASLDPQLARCMVNLARVRGNGTILDPFCGTGGIVIEAAFSGTNVVGYDTSSWMLKKCKENIAYYNLKNVRLEKKDATTFRKKCAAIVTEPPFGKNTKSQDLDTLYYDFLVNAKKNTKRIVMTFPHWIQWEKIVLKSGWMIVNHFSWYVHKSMTREIAVLMFT